MANQFDTTNYCSKPNQIAKNEQSFRQCVLDILCNLFGIFSGGSSGANVANFTQGKAGPITDTTAHTLTGMAGAAGQRIMLTSISITNGSPTVSTYVVVKTTGGDEIDRFYTSSGGGGADPTYPTPYPVPAGEGVTVTNLTTGSETYVNAKGYIQAA